MGGGILFLTLFIQLQPASYFFDATVFSGSLAFDLYINSHITNIFILEVIFGH